MSISSHSPIFFLIRIISSYLIITLGLTLLSQPIHPVTLIDLDNSLAILSPNQLIILVGGFLLFLSTLLLIGLYTRLVSALLMLTFLLIITITANPLIDIVFYGIGLLLIIIFLSGGDELSLDTKLSTSSDQ